MVWLRGKNGGGKNNYNRFKVGSETLRGRPGRGWRGDIKEVLNYRGLSIQEGERLI